MPFLSFFFFGPERLFRRGQHQTNNLLAVFLLACRPLLSSLTDPLQDALSVLVQFQLGDDTF